MPKHVLIVDDDVTVLETLAELVSSAGYEVQAVANFEDAHRGITAHPPDILVTDVRLGAFNGLQLAVLMRSVRPEAPIVVLSAYDDATLRIEAAHCHATYLTKPVTGAALLAALAGVTHAPAVGPTSKHIH